MQARGVTKAGGLIGLTAAVLLVGCTTTTSSLETSPPTSSSVPTATVTATVTVTTATATATATATGRTTTARHASGTASTPTAPLGTATAAAGSALAALQRLPVKGRAPKTGYSRARFGQAWTDDVTADGGHNGCDTRNDVLRRDLTMVIVKANTQGCVAASGTLHDPYTGREIQFVRGEKTSVLVQIDHVVALSDAWQTGAQLLDAAQRQNLANDPLELLAVDGDTNESKGNGDAATWLPPAKAFRCAYVARQIAVKLGYGLWVTAPERGAMESVLATCPTEALPTTSATDVPAVART